MTRRVAGFGTPSSSNVIVNIYDLHENNEILYPLGLGFYHSGVVIGRNEYTFGNIDSSLFIILQY